MGKSLRRVPAALLVLLALCVVETLAWAIVIPPLAGPDEVSHVAYVQKVVEAREIPWVRGHPIDKRPPYSTELGDAIIIGGVSPVDANRSGRPLGTGLDERIWEEREGGFSRSDRADGGYTSALRNPPAYYLYAAVPYLLTSPLGIFDQVFVMRLANIPLLLIIVIFAWLTAGELFGRRRWLQTLMAGAVALQPLLIHLTATINPDILLSAASSVALYLMIVSLKRGLTPRLAVALLALAALSSLTHGRGVALVGPVLLTIGLGVWKARRPGVRPRGRGAVAVAVLGAMAAVAAFVGVALKGAVTTTGLRQLGTYLWQFYFGRPEFLAPVGPEYGFREVMVERYFGGYAQFEVYFSAALNDAFWWGMIAIAVCAVVAIVKHGRLADQWDVVLVLASAPVATFALLHAIAFPLVIGAGDPIITGRYLLPLIALYGAAIALAVAWLPRRWGVALGGALLAALALIELGAMAITIERFYA